jgi:hypothetical protein
VLLALVVGIQASAVRRARRDGRELQRLRSELRIWSGSRGVRPGMSKEAVVMLLGEPDDVGPESRGHVDMEYVVRPHLLADYNLHIDGCTVRLTNGVVKECAIRTAMRH